MKNKNKDLLENWKTLIHKLEVQYDGYAEPLNLRDDELEVLIEFVGELLDVQKQEVFGDIENELIKYRFSTDMCGWEIVPKLVATMALMRKKYMSNNIEQRESIESEIPHYDLKPYIEDGDKKEEWVKTTPKKIVYYGKALKIIRSVYGYSQKELAHTTGLAQSVISRIESGERVPTESFIEVLLTELDIPRELFDFIAQVDDRKISEVQRKQLAVDFLKLLER